MYDREQRARCYSHFVAMGKSYELPCKEDAEENKTLLDVIYARDPETGLPTGDLAMFLNENTSLQVRQFISDNLHQEVNAETPSVPHDSEIDLS